MKILRTMLAVADALTGRRAMVILAAALIAFPPWLTTPSYSQPAPPNPPPISVKGANASLAVTAASANVALPSSTLTFPVVQLINDGTTELFYELGVGSGTAATTSSAPLPPGASVALFVGQNTFVAAISPGGASTLRVIQWNGAPTFARSGGGNPNLLNGATNVVVFAPVGGGSTTYTPTVGTKVIEVWLIGAGGGGGGGPLQASNAACSGGAGGGSATLIHVKYQASQFTAPIGITIGAGGVAGIAATTNTTAGGNGQVGGNTVFATGLGTVIASFGGGGGGGGQLANTSGGGAGAGYGSAGASSTGISGAAAGVFGNAGGTGTNGTSVTMPNVGSGGAGSPAAGTVGSSGRPTIYGGSMAGSGGGITTGNATSNGGVAGNVLAGGTGSPLSGGIAGVAGGAKTGGLGASPSAATAPIGVSGAAGGGGASDLTAAGAGGAGGNGGGGGGGGCAQNGGVAGTGGTGGDGRMVIVENL